MAGIALLSLLSILSVYAHLLLVEHATCPEHGELIDRPAGAPQGPPAALTRPQAHASWNVLGIADPHSHHHCEFVPKRREVFTPVGQSSPSLEPPSVRSAASTPCIVPRQPAVALFRLAPKQSPPA